MTGNTDLQSSEIEDPFEGRRAQIYTSPVPTPDPVVPVTVPPKQETPLMAVNNQTTVPKPRRCLEPYSDTPQVISDDETENATAVSVANHALRNKKVQFAIGSKCHSDSASSSMSRTDVQSPPSKKGKAQVSVPAPSSFGKYVWAKGILLKRKVKNGDQDLNLYPLMYLDEYINDPIVDSTKFIKFCGEKGAPAGYVKESRLDFHLDELMKRVRLLREGVIDEEIWKPLSEPIYCGIPKDVIILILLILFCYPEEEDKFLRIALLFCIGRSGWIALNALITTIDNGEYKFETSH